MALHAAPTLGLGVLHVGLAALELGGQILCEGLGELHAVAGVALEVAVRSVAKMDLSCGVACQARGAVFGEVVARADTTPRCQARDHDEQRAERLLTPAEPSEPPSDSPNPITAG